MGVVREIPGSGTFGTESSIVTRRMVLHLKQSEIPVRYAHRIFDHVGVPRIGEPHPDNSSLKCVSVSANPLDEKGYNWEITARYEMGKWEVPIMEEPQISISFNRTTRSTMYDVYGNAITNSAGDLFDPPIEVDDSRPVINIRRSTRFFRIEWLLSYKDAVNSDFFLGFAPGTLKVQNLGAVRKKDNFGLYYWTVHFEIEAKPIPRIQGNIKTGDPRPQAWDKIVIDQGLYEIDPATGQKRPIHDDYGEPVQQPVRLDGNGKALPPNSPISSTVWRVFRVYPRMPFSPLIA